MFSQLRSEHGETAKQLKEILGEVSPDHSTENFEDPKGHNVQIKVSPKSRKSNIIFQDFKLAKAAQKRVVSNSLQVSRTAAQPIVGDSIISAVNNAHNFINITSQNSIGSALDKVKKQGTIPPDVNPLLLAEDGGQVYYRTRN